MKNSLKADSGKQHRLKVCHWRAGLVLILGMLLVLMFLGVPAVAQEDEEEPQEVGIEGLTLEATAVFNGYVEAGYYLPVKVTIENTGRARHGEIRIVSQDPSHPLSAVFVADCDIPANSRKTYMLYPYFLREDPSPSIYVQYYERNPLLTAAVELNSMRNEERLWVEVNDEGADFSYLGGLTLSQCTSFFELNQLLQELEQEMGGAYGGPYGGGGSGSATQTYDYDPIKPLMAGCRPGDLPDRPEGYHMVSGLILNTRRYYELSEEQQAALTEWVISGGSVIVWLGDDPSRFQGSFLTGAVDGSGWRGPSALTEPPVRDTLSSLRTLPGFLGGREMLGNYPVTYANQDSARTLLSEGNIPILQHISVGKGNVLLSALDLASLKRMGVSGLDDYFSFMMGYIMASDGRLNLDLPAFQMVGYRPYGGQETRGNPYPEGSLYRILHEFDNVLQSDNLTALPGLGAIALFLACYIIIIGPVNYFILLKLRHREWLWYSIPVLVAAFCLFSYTWALSTKGSRLLLTRVNIEDAYPEHRMGWEMSSFGLFSPSATNYNIRLESERDLIRGLELPSLDTGIPGMPGSGAGDRSGSVGGLELVQDGRRGEAYIRDAHIRIWSEAHFYSEGATQFPGICSLENVGLDGSHLRGTMNVNLDFELLGPFLIYATRGSYVSQALETGGATAIRNGSFDFDLFIDMRTSSFSTTLDPDSAATPKSVSLRDAAVQAISDRRISSSSEDEIILAGWRSGTSSRPLGSPRSRISADETLVLIHMPLRMESGDLAVDGGRGTILSLKAGEMELEQSGALRLTNGRLLYSVNFPPVGNLLHIPEILEININTDRQSGHVPVVTYVFNHLDGEWVSPEPVFESASRQTLHLTNITRYIAPDNRSMFIMVEAGQNQAGEGKVSDRIISLTGITVNVPDYGQ